MFTGIIEEIGKVKAIKPFGQGIRISISAKSIMESISLGDSISINGTCQTVIEIGKGFFDVEAVEETLRKTTLGKLKNTAIVNLESSLTLNKKLGGHFVLGHIDTTGKIKAIKKLASSNLVTISYPTEYSKYIINVGSIAIDGVSLTVADFSESQLTVSIIPHTWKTTTLSTKKTGDEVNLEFDILGKYIARLINKDKSEKVTEEWLRELGSK